MSGITRRYDRIQARAAGLLIQTGGVAFLDALSIQAAKSHLVTLAWALKNEMGCTYKTARQHIARACRRARHPDYRPPTWGGDRSQL